MRFSQTPTKGDIVEWEVSVTTTEKRKGVIVYAGGDSADVELEGGRIVSLWGTDTGIDIVTVTKPRPTTVVKGDVWHYNSNSKNVFIATDDTGGFYRLMGSCAGYCGNDHSARPLDRVTVLSNINDVAQKLV